MSDDTTMLAAELRAMRARLERLERLETPRFIGARYATGAAQSIPNASYTIIDFGTKVYDPLNLVTTGAGWKFTAPIGGYYEITSFILFTGSSQWTAGEVGELDVYRSGARYTVLDYKPWGDLMLGLAVQASLLGTAHVSLVAGDTLDLRVFQATGSALALFNSDLYNHVSIARIG